MYNNKENTVFYNKFSCIIVVLAAIAIVVSVVLAIFGSPV
jgi:hypothetical protein